MPLPASFVALLIPLLLALGSSAVLSRVEPPDAECIPSTLPPSGFPDVEGTPRPRDMTGLRGAVPFAVLRSNPRPPVM